MHRFTYILFYSFALFLMILPRPLRKGLFKGIAIIFFKLFGRYRRVVYANLDVAFPGQLSAIRKREIAKNCFISLTYEILSVIENHFTPIEKLNASVSTLGKEKVDAIKKEGKSIIFATFHYDNLEYAGLALGTVSKTVHVVQKASNPYIDRFIAKSREKNGIKTVPMSKAVRHLTKQLKDGGDISIVVDQSVNADAGIMVEFFNQPTIHLSTASYLARKFDAVLMPVILKWHEGVPTLEFHDPIPFTPTEDYKADIHYLTQAQATFLEKAIKEDPQPWFWCHKRWKYNRPELYV